MIGPLFDMFTVAMFIFFPGKFLNECKPRTTLYPLLQPGPPGLAFYGSRHFPGWLRSMKSETFLKMISFFKAIPPNRLPIYLGSMLHIISFLFSKFRSWDYPENIGFSFQLDRKSETWFFTFLNVYVSWIKQTKS